MLRKLFGKTSPICLYIYICIYCILLSYLPTSLHKQMYDNPILFDIVYPIPYRDSITRELIVSSTRYLPPPTLKPFVLTGITRLWRPSTGNTTHCSERPLPIEEQTLSNIYFSKYTYYWHLGTDSATQNVKF